MNLSTLRNILPNIRVFLLISAVSIPQLILAQAPVQQASLQNPIRANSIAELVQLIFDVITIIVIPFAIFFLVRTGFYFATAGGSEDKIKHAKADFLYVVVGLFIILAAQLMGSILENTIKEIRR